jgi:parallel beta-helix repeat protein
MTTITVANRSQLDAALSSAKGGETIVLKDGNYGSIRLVQDYASTVTIQSEKPHGATIRNLEVFGASNLKFEDINFHSGGNGGLGRGIISIEQKSENIQILDSKIFGSVDGSYRGHNGVYVRDSNKIVVKGNDIHDVSAGIVVFGSSGSSFHGNKIDYIDQDAMKFAGLRNSSVTDNTHGGHHYPHPGVHPDFIQFQGSSSDVHIEGNVFLPKTISWVQGIFMNAGVYKNITIENNIVYNGMIHGVTVEDGSGIVVRNNTLLNTPGEGHSSTQILVPPGSIVQNNIISGKAGGGLFGSNIRLQNSDPSKPFYVEDFFQNGAKGRGVTLDDLRPVAGSLAETKGATERLAELLGSKPTKPGVGDGGGSGGGEGTADEIAINAGGGAVAGFDKDTGFTGGKLYGSKSAIANTTDDALYQAERYGNFKYAFAVENGTYAVTLKFAELYWSAAGKRVFDVKAEGALVLDNLDVFRMAGGKNVAWDKTIAVEVRDGRLDLDFITVTDNAKIGAIEITPLDIATVDTFDLL